MTRKSRTGASVANNIEVWTSLEGLAELLATTPIHRFLGFQIVRFDKAAGTLSISCPTSGGAERSDGAGQAHGGAIATLIDTTATFAACVAAGRSVPTMNLHVDYLRPAAGPEMTATATIRKQGRGDRRHRHRIGDEAGGDRPLLARHGLVRRFQCAQF
jgi:uncharacterized protein (TIGR00369 family)